MAETPRRIMRRNTTLTDVNKERPAVTTTANKARPVNLFTENVTTTVKPFKPEPVKKKPGRKPVGSNRQALNHPKPKLKPRSEDTRRATRTRRKNKIARGEYHPSRLEIELLCETARCGWVTREHLVTITRKKDDTIKRALRRLQAVRALRILDGPEGTQTIAAVTNYGIRAVKMVGHRESAPSPTNYDHTRAILTVSNLIERMMGGVVITEKEAKAVRTTVHGKRPKWSPRMLERAPWLSQVNAEITSRWVVTSGGQTLRPDAVHLTWDAEKQTVQQTAVEVELTVKTTADKSHAGRDPYVRTCQIYDNTEAFCNVLYACPPGIQKLLNTRLTKARSITGSTFPLSMAEILPESFTPLSKKWGW